MVVIKILAVSSTPVTQRSLSKKLECHLFNSLLGASSMADRAHLLCVSAFHAASWLSVTPSLALGLQLEPNKLHASIRWWLELDTSLRKNMASHAMIWHDLDPSHGMNCHSVMP